MTPDRAKAAGLMLPVRHDLKVAGQTVTQATKVHLCPESDPGFYVDGIAQQKRIAMVTDQAPPPDWMTGVNWHLHPLRNGAWRLVNQNEMQHCLTAVSGRLELRPALPGPAAAASSWLIYRTPGQDAFCLRYLKGQWLCWRNGEIGLGHRNGPDDNSVLWRFQRPVATGQEAAPAAAAGVQA